MVRELEIKRQGAKFPETAPAANPVFFRTYSRRTEAGLRETWDEVCDRTIQGLVELGKLTPEEAATLEKTQRKLQALPSGRWLWVGGTDWINKSKNFSGAYNCTSTNLRDWNAFGLMMNLAMMGCGTGAVIEPQYINQLPPIRNRLHVTVQGNVGDTTQELRREYTQTHIEGNTVTIHVGDSREGWVGSYQTLLELSTDERFTDEVQVIVDVSDVRQAGETLKGFGGVANPVKLPGLYQRCAAILNKAVGRQLTSVECCLLIDEAAVTIVAGNIRRCLPEDALVHTEAGLVPIAKVRVGDRVLTSKGFYPVTNFFIQGEQSLCRIRTQDGFFECTPDHKVAVLTDVYGNYQMVKAKDLQSGDRLIFVPQSIPGTPTELPEFRGKIQGKIKPITVPALTPNVAYFIGYLHGDGSVSSDGSRVRFRVHQDSPKILERLIAVGAEFGLETYTLRTPEKCKTKAYELQFNSAALNQYLKSFKQSFQALIVPDCILLGTAEIRKAYLAGLADADGCHSQGVLVASVQQRFLQQIQTLYASLGITVRLCASIRKRTGKWEGELVTVGATAFEQVGDFLERYSLQFSDQKRLTPTSFKDHGFPKAMIRPIVNTSQYHWGHIHTQMPAPTVKKYIPEATDLVPVKVVGVEMNVRSAPTYDIEVANVHEFVCEGILVSNSAGMRQFISDDEQGATAKDNLWQQDENGNWRIDPERDALRMANHTRVFHRKPTLEECINAVRKQYYSGEGAIQWAGEAVARANCDLLTTQALKADFIKAYEQGTAKDWLQKRHPEIDAKELEHRLARFGLNPCGEILGSDFHCVSGDTLLITKDGMHKIQDVVGCEISIWNGKHWSQVQPFQTGSSRILYRVRFGDGSYLDATEYHRFFVKDRFSKSYKEVQTKDLMDTSRYAIHTEPFKIQYEDGLDIDRNYAYTLGLAVGDGTTDQKNHAKIRLYQEKVALNLAGNKSPIRDYGYSPAFTDVTDLGFSGGFLKSLKTNPEALNVIASWNRQAILHFIAGLADTDGSNTSSNGIRIYISDYERAYRVQLLLTKCGIRSSVNLLAHKGSVTNYGIRSRDLYYLQITECGEIPCQRLDVSKGTNAKYKGKWQVVKSVEQLPGLHDTYCFNEPEYHKGVFGNTLTGNCNLSEIHLNQIDPSNHKEQEEAFTAGALSVASLLNHQFQEQRYQYSRELDPIVGVSFTGLFDFFVHAFGVDWLRWWEAGRPETPQGLTFKHREAEYLTSWKEIVQRVVWDYCDRHHLKRPNRCTTVQPSGTKSLLTGASPGWHPPKAQRFIRRITCRKNDPVALACLEYGYSIIPSQSDKDEQGNLLNDPFDPRVTEWLVEIPVAVSWADLPGADVIDISKFNAIAQMDFYMQVQKFYVTHNTSATIELREHEVETLGTRIWEAINNDEGYMSAALLARFDDHQTFPRLPFEPISKQEYEQMLQAVAARRKTDDFYTVLSRYDFGDLMEVGPAGCDSDKCMMPEQSPN
ncbi:ribonucleoside-triphosphate reductase, adenosylcobalamin-dependent [Nostoc sp. CMAA1605]|uniref:ribonucleoside-triphosphate reductase, adenosylcobalamin-dependent n=1 Tax=Nostoc sp. CMAA1605 TaxID=2055159 RepID=UPI001F236A8D|nr:ribonucleoside-triphosphate reductase, adenosylcobalamin-dependent [Nostoc sp. CMAA1605]MCF4970376.1 ribonucleoside-triphosphate reductase, adenosylcobalamin-dependent [Nostoc sp. CMAA1605]